MSPTEMLIFRRTLPDSTFHTSKLKNRVQFCQAKFSNFNMYVAICTWWMFYQMKEILNLTRQTLSHLLGNSTRCFFFRCFLKKTAICCMLRAFSLFYFLVSQRYGHFPYIMGCTLCTWGKAFPVPRWPDGFFWKLLLFKPTFPIRVKQFSRVLECNKAKKKMSCFRKPNRPSHFARDSKFFRHNLHSVKIGNLRSVSQAPFRLHSIVSVQRQHGKTGAQVNRVVVFFPNVRIRDRYSRKCSDIIAGFITFTKYKGQFCTTVPSVSLFKVPAVYEHRFTPIMVRNNFHLFVNKHVVCQT